MNAPAAAPTLSTDAVAVRDPRTGAYDYAFPRVTANDLDTIAAGLRTHQPAWRALGFEGRIAKMQALAEAIRARRSELVAAVKADTGRRRIAGQEVDGVLGGIAGWSATAPHLLPEGWVQGRMAPHIRHAPQWAPYPLIGVISPWNFPLLLSMIDSTPALIAGCAVMLKPSEVTPRFADPLRRAIADVPGLGDVFAVVQGDGAVGAGVVDRVDGVCFTGSVATGRKVAVQAAGRFIPAFLELGGKDPMIVLEDADLDVATDTALRGSVVATGHACQSIERIYVARAIYDAFVTMLVQKAEAVRLTWPDAGMGEVGPIIFDRQADILAAQIADARAKGAAVLTGGEVETHGGRWLRPTVITGVTPDMLVMREETFGPIMPVTPFDSVDEAVEMANASEYGLSASVMSASLDAAEAVGRRLNVGAVSLNDACLTGSFHEAAKQSFGASGIGPSRMGADGLQRFFRRKALIVQTQRPAAIHQFREEG